MISPCAWEWLLQYGYVPWCVLAFVLVFINGPINRLLKLGKYPHIPAYSAVVITGCDSGFGLYMAQKLRKLGYVVVSTCFTSEGCAHLNKQGIHTVQLDLTKPGAYDLVAKTTRKALDATPGARLWAVINNAGVAPMGFLDWLSVDMFRWAMDVNFFAVVGVTQALLPLLKLTAGARVINISSMAGLSASVSFGAYSGSKHAVEGFGKALRLELLPFNVYVSNVNPGFMATPLIKASMDRAQELFDSAPASVKQLYHSGVLRENAEGLLRIQESPTVVGDYIVDHLVTTKYPNFTNYVGWQANVLRWFLMLPHLLQEALIRLGTPIRGVKHEQVSKLQAASASVAAAAAAAAVAGESKSESSPSASSRRSRSRSKR